MSFFSQLHRNIKAFNYSFGKSCKSLIKVITKVIENINIIVRQTMFKSHILSLNMKFKSIVTVI